MAVPFENRNFHKEMLKLAGQLQKEGKVPRLLLHSCPASFSISLWKFLFSNGTAIKSPLTNNLR